MTSLRVAAESWPLREKWTISRGSVAAVEVVTVTLEADGLLARGECRPYPRYGETVEGVMAASRIPGIREVSVTVREGYELTPLPEGGTYLGFVFALGDDPAGVEESLRRAREAIRVIVAPSLAVEVGG